MKLILFSILPLLLIKFSAYSQITFQSASYDFSELKNWSQTPAIFEFINSGIEEDAFLKVVKNENVHVKYPTNYILPGEKGKVLIYFEPPAIGRFNEKIKVFIASSEKPVELTITGNVNSVQECPSLNMPVDPALLTAEHVVEVLDSITKNPVQGADVIIINGFNRQWSKRTNKSGRITQLLDIGMYNIIVTAEGYHLHDGMYYINKNKPLTTIELSKSDSLLTDTSKKVFERQPKVLPFVIKGIVVNALTMESISGAYVNSEMFGAEIKNSYYSLPDGSFSLKLSKGQYFIECSKKGFEKYSRFIFIEKESDTIFVPLVPEKEIIKPVVQKPSDYIAVSGIVIDAKTEQPVANAYIRFIDEYGVAYPYTTFKDGKFNKELLKGSYQVKIRAKNYKDYIDTLTVTQSKSGITYILIPNDFDLTYTEPDEEKKPDTISKTTVVVPDTGFSEVHYNANNIVFLVDVSSSMGKAHKLESLKIAMIRLANMLRRIDRLSLISFASNPSLLFADIPADQKDTIISTIAGLSSYGLTFGIKGLETAYQLALANYIEGGNNQLIIATDGDFNSPDHSELELMNMIIKYANKGIILSVVGFGTDNPSIRRMKAMATLGKGKYLHIDNPEQAQSVLIEEIKENSRKQ